jgi:hypothetical protein
MKNFTTVTVLAVIITFCSILSACSKSTPDVNKPIEATEGKWAINRVQLRIYYGGVFYKDTIVPNKPQGENSLVMDASMNFQFRYNSTVTDAGTYTFPGNDSIIATTSTTVYHWKMLTLTDVLFTAKSTTNANPAFPGATVETYYTFVR